jgi:hypothetical protein
MSRHIPALSKISLGWTTVGKRQKNSYMNFLTPPDVIFKYFRPERSGILKDLKIRFANPAEFNDPFEVCPRFDQWVKTRMNEEVQKHVVGNAQLGISAGESLKFHEHKMKQTLPAHIQFSSHDFQKRCGEQFRMLCFSESIQSPLMWGHYSDSQRGFALGFYTSHPFFHKRLVNIHYDEQRPCFDDKERILWTKNHEWEYEKEWRVIQNVESTEPYFETLPVGCIKAVYFGLKMCPDVRREIDSALNSPYHADVRKFSMELDPAEYKLKPIPVPAKTTP